MCFMAGANAVFTGDHMLTTPCELMPVLALDEIKCLAASCIGSPWDEVGSSYHVRGTFNFGFTGQSYDVSVGTRRHAKF
jgi:hypothetical protein